PFAAVQAPAEEADQTARVDRQVVPATDYKLTNNTTSFTVAAPGPGIAVLGESYEEGNFRVTVNGSPASYFRLNHVFKGIRIDGAGTYRIAFSYWPKRLNLSLWISLCGLALLAGTFGFICIGRHLPRWNGPAGPLFSPAP